MKTFLIIGALFITFSISMQANELGKRYLKLGNTYRESGNYEKAEEYLKQGQKMVSNDGYWSATAHEFMGYLYRDMVASGNYNDNADYFNALAKDHLDKALAGFQKAVKQNDGSPAALSSIKERIQDIRSATSNGKSNSAGKSSPVNYSNAKIVNYDNAKIKEVPNDMPSTLENFSAVNNRIKEIPAALTQSKGLKFLNLKKNRITSIANAASGMPKLRVLNLSENKLKTIPDNIGDMKQLEILDLSKNKLKQLPSSIMSLKNLKVLDISGNKIQFSQISTLLKNMPNTNIIFDKYELVDDEADTLDEEMGGAIQGK